ncbi:MAG: alpha/beta hydrolase [Desulfatibacillum sp.]|nr:alpha/beta hydrolase [Desulfatibacillum sp.]
MPYSPYTVPGVTFREELVRVSDGVTLKVVEFIPPDEDESLPVMVFVAGWISLIKGWTEVLQELTPRFRTLYVETREKISADLPDFKNLDFSVARMARDVVEVVDAMVPADRVFAYGGSSLGSTVVLELMSWDERQPAAGLLVGPVPEFHFPAWGIPIIRHCPPSLYTIVKPIIKWYLKYIRVDRKNEPEQIAKYYGTLDAAEPARLKANAMCLQNFSLWEKLPDVKAPVVIIGTKTDSLHGLEVLEKVVDLLPQGEMALMDSNKDAHSAKAGQLMVERLDRIAK